MLSSNRGHYLALGGCLVSLLLAIPALGQEAVEPEDRPAENQDATPEPQEQTPEDAAVKAPSAVAPVTPSEPSSAAHDGKDQSGENAEPQEPPGISGDNGIWGVWGDTLAQWAMAVFGAAATGISVAALILVRKTLKATHRTLREAGRTTRAAVRAAVAAEESVVAAREGNQRQLRAYVARSDFGWTAPTKERPGIIRIRWRNCGATPARRCRARVRLDWTMQSLPDDFDYPSDMPESPFTKETALAPGLESGIDALLPMAAVEEVARKERTLFLWSWFEYNDIFQGTPRRRSETCVRITISPDLTAIYAMAYGPYNGTDDDCHHKPKT